MVTADWSKKTSDVPEGARRQWRADRALRPPMRSPGSPTPSRAVQRQFWRLIATGITSAEAALNVGVSVPVGTRWFRHSGGMPPLSLIEPSRRYLSFEEREEIALLRAQKMGVRQIERDLAPFDGRGAETSLGFIEALDWNDEDEGWRELGVSNTRSSGHPAISRR